jgi:hypothetical protein
MSYTSSATALSALSAEAKQLLLNGAKAEQMASDILAHKRNLVELDKQRQECVQALATLRSRNTAAAAASAGAVLPSALNAPPPSRLWVSLSGNFVHFPRDAVKSSLETDRARLDNEIARVRAEMKEAMKQLQTLAPAVGLDKGTIDFALS